MFYTVYKVTNLLTGHIYVGAHKTKDLSDGYMGSGVVINHSINKYGIENFKKEILYLLDSKEEMYLKEKEIVNEEFLLREDTYNLKQGVDGGWDYINSNRLNVTEKSLAVSLQNLEKANAKNRELFEKGLHRKGFKHTDETKQKISKSNIGKQAGENNPMYNKKAIKKDGISICVDISLLESYFAEGWELGQIQNKPDFSGDKNPQYGKVWFTNGDISLPITKDKIEEYTANGFWKGRTLKQYNKSK